MRKFLILPLLMVFISNLFGTQTVSLEEAKVLLLRNNPEYIAKQSALSSAEWGVRQSLTALFPTARLQAGYNYFDPVPRSIPFAQENYTVSYGLQFNQPLFMGGKLWFAYRMQRDRVKIAQADYDNTRLTLLSKLEESYYNYLLTKQLYKINENSLVIARHNLEIANTRLESGSLSRAGYLQMQAELSSKEVSLLQAENAQQLSYRQLQNMIKTGDFDIVDVDMSRYEELISFYEGLNADDREQVREKLVEHGMTANPLILITRAGKDIGRKALHIAKGNFLPTINLSASRTWNDGFSGMDNFNEETTYVLSASLPIFPLFDNFAGYRKTYHSFRQTSMEAESAEDKIKMAIEASFYSGITSAKSITSAELAADYAVETYKMMEERFRNGLISSVDLISIELLRTSAELNAAAAKYNFLKNRSSLMNLLNIENDLLLLNLMEAAIRDR